MKHTRYNSIEEVKGAQNIAARTNMKFAYFFDGTTILKQGHEKEYEMKKWMMEVIGIPMLFVTVVFMLIGIVLVKKRAKKITQGIHRFYETLKEIQDQMQQ